MKIILQKPVENLGTPGEVVNVADGYARNYLIPRGLAVVASKGSVRHAESLKRAHGQRQAKAKEEAEAVAAGLRALTLKMSARAGEDGKLFGSVTAADLAEELAKEAVGVLIDRHDVTLDDPIRSLGVHQYKVRLGHEVEAEISVEVVAEQ